MQIRDTELISNAADSVQRYLRPVSSTSVV